MRMASERKKKPKTNGKSLGHGLVWSAGVRFSPELVRFTLCLAKIFHKPPTAISSTSRPTLGSLLVGQMR